LDGSALTADKTPIMCWFALSDFLKLVRRDMIRPPYSRAAFFKTARTLLAGTSIDTQHAAGMPTPVTAQSRR
jgi:hypothetical protein